MESTQAARLVASVGGVAEGEAALRQPVRRYVELTVCPLTEDPLGFRFDAAVQALGPIIGAERQRGNVGRRSAGDIRDQRQAVQNVMMRSVELVEVGLGRRSADRVA